MGILTREKIYATKVETDGDIIYLGEAVPGSTGASPVWRIRKIDTDGIIETTWAGGGSFNQIWNDRASLTYI